MYQPNFYKEINESTITEDVRKEGFSPFLIRDTPGRVYTLHRHSETKLLVFLEGEMTVKVGEDSFECRRGDRLLIPGDVEHAAIVGSAGCLFLWSEKL